MRSLLMRRGRKPAELLLVPMIDIFTVLVAFLLMTAVFSRIAIMQIDLPSSAPAKPEEPKFRLEVIVRQDGFQLSDGKQLIASIPKLNGAASLTDAIGSIIEQVAEGSISPEEGHQLAALLDMKRRSHEAAAFGERITRIEEALAKRNSREASE